MEIKWDIAIDDIDRLKAYIDQNMSHYVQNRIDRNINRNNIATDRDAILKSMLLCLMTPGNRTESDKRIAMLISKEPFLLGSGQLEDEHDISGKLTDILTELGLTRYIGSVPDWFTTNYCHLENTDWALMDELSAFIASPPGVCEERELADRIDRMFKGFGSSRARIFLMNIGISRYEIPVDLLTIRWMKEFRIPVSFSLAALQDIHFYHFVSDGIQLLCEKAGIFPAVLDAAIVSQSMDTSSLKHYLIS